MDSERPPERDDVERLAAITEGIAELNETGGWMARKLAAILRSRAKRLAESVDHPPTDPE